MVHIGFYELYDGGNFLIRMMDGVVYRWYDCTSLDGSV